MYEHEKKVSFFLSKNNVGNFQLGILILPLLIFLQTFLCYCPDFKILKNETFLLIFKQSDKGLPEGLGSIPESLRCCISLQQLLHPMHDSIYTIRMRFNDTL